MSHKNESHKNGSHQNESHQNESYPLDSALYRTKLNGSFESFQYKRLTKAKISRGFVCEG